MLTLQILRQAAAGIREVADAGLLELPASFKAASGKTYVREESHGDAMYQSIEATYMDDKGGVLGGYTSPSGMTGHRITYTVKLDGQSLDAGSAWDDDSGSGYKFYEYGTGSDGKITGVTASENGDKVFHYKVLTESHTKFGEANPWQTKDYVFQINDDFQKHSLRVWG